MMIRRHTALVVTATVITALAGTVLWAQGRGGGRRAAVADSRQSVILGRPTDRSIVVSVLYPKAVEAQVEYGTTAGAYPQLTPVSAGPAATPFEILVDGLTPNTRYFYRLRTREAGAKEFTSGTEASFMTARTPGSTFSFGVQGDSHPERDQRMYDATLYERTMDLVKAERPDLYFMLGDDFSIEREIANNTLSQNSVNAVYAGQRPFLARMAGSTSLFHVNGNHEEAGRFLLNGTATSAPVLAGLARNAYFPLPAPDRFYSGDEERVEHVGLLRDYYAFTWGDALFVTIDPYWHSSIQVDADPGGRAGGGNAGGGGGGGGRGGGKGGGAAKGGNAMNAAGVNRNLWSITLGDAQYAWLKKTLESSPAKFKFVFAHHVMGTGRGAVEVAGDYEWGGRDPRGGKSFKDMRPSWEMPIHQLFVKTGVTIFFQGHDHLFARQEKDGVIYQEVPNPADLTYTAFNRDAYRSGDVLPNTGHLLVTVSPEQARVDYVRSFLAKDESATQQHGGTAFSYTVRPRRGASASATTPGDTRAMGASSLKGGSDGTVTDTATGLMWQQGDSGELTWEQAQQYARALSLAGHTDWRLPTAQELFGILDHNRNPALDPAMFPPTGAEYWWSSQSLLNDPNRVWVINSGGGSGPHPRNETISAGGGKRFHVRCVRATSPSSSTAARYQLNGDGTVSDLVSHLMWQRDEAGTDMTWDDALQYAKGLALGGRSDWRVPTIKELETLNDESRVNPSIDRDVFPGAQPVRYWSSTTLFGRDTLRAWFLEFRAGITSYDPKTTRHAVRCVRRIS